jgi:hypothetical protein
MLLAIAGMIGLYNHAQLFSVAMGSQELFAKAGLKL